MGCWFVKPISQFCNTFRVSIAETWVEKALYIPMATVITSVSEISLGLEVKMASPKVTPSERWCCHTQLPWLIGKSLSSCHSLALHDKPRCRDSHLINTVYLRPSIDEDMQDTEVAKPSRQEKCIHSKLGRRNEKYVQPNCRPLPFPL